jgi:hypothetical protein
MTKPSDVHSPNNSTEISISVKKQSNSDDDDDEMSEKEIDKLYDGKSIFANRTVQHKPITRKQQLNSDSDGEMSEKEIDRLYDGKSIFANRTVQHKPITRKPATNLLEILKHNDANEPLKTTEPINEPLKTTEQISEPLKVHEQISEPLKVHGTYTVRQNIIGANMIKTEFLSCVNCDLISYFLFDEKYNVYKVIIDKNFFNKECDLFKFLNDKSKVHLAINFGNDYPNIDKLTIAPFQYPCVNECLQKIKSKWNFNSMVGDIFDEIKTSFEKITMSDMENYS